MRSVDAFAEYHDTVSQYFDVGAMYVLSAISSPQSARDEALAMADRGEHVTHADSAANVMSQKTGVSEHQLRCDRALGRNLVGRF